MDWILDETFEEIVKKAENDDLIHKLEKESFDYLYSRERNEKISKDELSKILKLQIMRGINYAKDAFKEQEYEYRLETFKRKMAFISNEILTTDNPKIQATFLCELGLSFTPNDLLIMFLRIPFLPIIKMD